MGEHEWGCAIVQTCALGRRGVERDKVGKCEYRIRLGGIVHFCAVRSVGVSDRSADFLGKGRKWTPADGVRWILTPFDGVWRW